MQYKQRRRISRDREENVQISGAVFDPVKRKILIVDDEPAIADTLDYVLRTDGFEPVCVGLGQLALKEIKTNEFALVILDIGLPDISGFDVCRELRRHSNVPVIFLTARSDEVDRIVGGVHSEAVGAVRRG